MLRTLRRTSGLALLAATLMLLPATPAVAAPAELGAATWLVWLQGWLPGSPVDCERSRASAEAAPRDEPDAKAPPRAVVEPAPDSDFTQSAGGEGLPGLDPDG